jgi:transposase
VRRLLKHPNLPETAPHRPRFGRSILDPYKLSLLEWWNAGIKQVQPLMALLKQQGVKGSDRTLTRYISQLREAQGLPPMRATPSKRLAKVIGPQLPPFTARRASYLISKRAENRDVEDQRLVGLLIAEHPDLAQTVDLAESFLQLLRQRCADDFDT